MGDPLPSLRWYLNGVMVDLSDNSKYSTLSIPLVETTVSFLVIIHVQSSDVGTYTCEAQNIIGSDRSFGILTVNGMYVCVHM